MLCLFGSPLPGQVIYETNFNSGDMTGQGSIGEYSITGSTINSSLISGLHNPWGIASEGNDLFVANPGYPESIGEYTLDGVTVNPALISGIYDPFRVKVSGPNLYVLYDGLVAIGKFTTSGAAVEPLLITGLWGEEGLALSGDDLFVAPRFANPKTGLLSIGEYSTAGATITASLISITPPADVDYGFVSIAVGGGHIFLGDIDGVISEYDLDGTLVNDDLISMPGYASDIAIFGTDLFITNGYTDVISEYTTSGATVNANLVTGLDDPTSLVVVPEKADSLRLLGWSLAGLGLCLGASNIRRLKAVKQATANR